ncbi:hypothetical protein RCG19_15995 [Neobacillus sp. OS1-2]|uniref:hypothetical protein n=1 Tax=Neobacillus sp. OS1-2 TaxID=3070680 RepID=UPI0027DFCEDF|nr:hypothetical protein [Neobacillus sp. OS1-2]WML38690.1 hypothetical protein RCG19_15995 [Neobacillus sp. OS1-2]
MEFTKELNIAIGCVMASHLEMKEKRVVIDSLRQMEAKIEKYKETAKTVEPNKFNPCERCDFPYAEETLKDIFLCDDRIAELENESHEK